MFPILQKNDINEKKTGLYMAEKKLRRIVKFLDPLASLKLTVISLLLLAALVIAGTIIQAGSGFHSARHDVFGSWLIWLFGVIPLPGMRTTVLLLFINLLAAVCFRLKFCRRQAGLLLIHCGLLLLIAGGLFSADMTREYTLTLSEGESSRFVSSRDDGTRTALPMTVKLLDFARAMHPGSDIPRSFSSRVEISVAGRSRQAVISMNRPLRWRGYTFFQSSYADDGKGGESSTFSVVRNPGRRLPYAASAMIFLGLACHFLTMLLASKKNAQPAREQSEP